MDSKLRVGDRVLIEETSTTVSRYLGTVIGFIELDRSNSPEVPAAPLNGYCEKLKGTLIEMFSITKDGGSAFDDGWNEALREVADNMGLRLTYEPARVTCEDAA